MAAQDIGVVYVHVEPSGKGFGKSIEGDIGDAVSKASRKGSNTLISKIGGAFGKIGKVGTGAIATITGGITALAAKGGFTRASTSRTRRPSSRASATTAPASPRS
ncbi:hypothetical protein DWX12_02025 [Bifidobacterium pseudocatenulatum]|nr:hypothetical protein DWX12_02025 [Bifidobacterium pseudocatenulatum]